LKTVQDTAAVTMEFWQEVVCSVSNRAIFDDLVWLWNADFSNDKLCGRPP